MRSKLDTVESQSLEHRWRWRVWLCCRCFKGELLVAEKIVDHIEATQERSRHIGGILVNAGKVTNHKNHTGEDRGPNNDATGIDGQAAQPFFEVVSFGLEDESFVREESDGDAENAGKHAARNVPISRPRFAEPVSEQHKSAVAKGSVPDSDQHVAKKLPGWKMRENAPDNGVIDQPSLHMHLYRMTFVKL